VKNEKIKTAKSALSLFSFLLLPYFTVGFIVPDQKILNLLISFAVCISFSSLI
jgi:hypothetical protein